MTATLRLGNGNQPPTPRADALRLLAAAGFQPDTPITTNIGIVAPLGAVLIATAEMESDLYVDAQPPLPNANGTTDAGWLQINSAHGFDQTRILRDALYTADCAFDVYSRQGITAWAAYGYRHDDEPLPYRYLRRMPPAYGGAQLVPNPTGPAATNQRELVRSVQAHLNLTAPGTPLVCDGGFGNLTRARLLEWKRAHHNDGHDRVDARVWLKMAGQGLR